MFNECLLLYLFLLTDVLDFVCFTWILQKYLTQIESFISSLIYENISKI